MHVERPHTTPSRSEPETVNVGVTRVGDWFRLLRSILALVVPTAIAGMHVTATPERGAGPGLAAVASMVVNLIVHTCFWVSLVYAYVDWRERIGEERDTNPPRLAVVGSETRIRRVRSTTRRVPLGEVIGPLAIWASYVAFVFGQRHIAPLDPAGAVVPVLAPATWPVWAPGLGWMAANVSAALIATFRMGRWTPLTTTVAVGASFSVMLGMTQLIVNERWVSDRYVSLMAIGEQAREHLRTRFELASLAIVMVATIWTTVVALNGWQRDRKAPPFRYR